MYRDEIFHDSIKYYYSLQKRETNNLEFHKLMGKCQLGSDYVLSKTDEND
jgi:hypothetical protein